MKTFEIYYGLGGGFGGAKYGSTEEFETEEEALDYAYFEAMQEFENMAGRHGLSCYEDFLIEASQSLGEDEEVEEVELHSMADDLYMAYCESWLRYNVKEII